MKKDILSNPYNVKFNDLIKICTKYFGLPRIKGSHHIFKTPWKGDPRINIQKDLYNLLYLKNTMGEIVNEE